MSASQTMPGPDGAPARAFHRSARQVIAGDWLPEHAAHAVAPALVATDPDTGRERVWVTLDNGTDLELTRRARVWLHRTYSAPEWLRSALDDYRAARHAWEALRESGEPIPAGAVAGAAGSSVAFCQLEEADFRAAFPPPRYADFVRGHADRRRVAA